MISNTQQKVLIGIKEILDRMRSRVERRIVTGRKKTIPMRAVDPALLWELHKAAQEMYLSVLPELDMKTFKSACERHQNALSKVTGWKHVQIGRGW